MSTGQSRSWTARIVTSPITAILLRERTEAARCSPIRRKKFRNAEGDANVHTSGGLAPIYSTAFSSPGGSPVRRHALHRPSPASDLRRDHLPALQGAGKEKTLPRKPFTGQCLHYPFRGMRSRLEMDA